MPDYGYDGALDMRDLYESIKEEEVLTDEEGDYMFSQMRGTGTRLVDSANAKQSWEAVSNSGGSNYRGTAPAITTGAESRVGKAGKGREKTEKGKSGKRESEKKGKSGKDKERERDKGKKYKKEGKDGNEKIGKNRGIEAWRSSIVDIDAIPLQEGMETRTENENEEGAFVFSFP
jgi:hypothetical protein